MTSMNHQSKNQGKEFEYLCVDDFLKDIFHTRALATAFETGLIDALIQNKAVSYRSLLEKGGADAHGMRLLLALLLENRVVENCDGAIQLTGEFVHALEFRDILELKSVLANLAAHDFLNYFSDMVYNPDRFFHEVKFFRLFAYDRCLGESKEDYEAAKRWMRITTTLTKYEAQVCMKYYDFGRHRNILDIGGNSGEFALRICRRHPGVKATVFDLPLVCEVGRHHLENEPEAGRISFIKGNALTDPLPAGYDLISFKSMLHDWPEREAFRLINNASRSLAPGGTLLIFERGPIETGKRGFPFSMIPILLFSLSFRSPEIYEEQFKKLGFQDIKVKKLCLDTPFFIMTAKKGDNTGLMIPS